MAKFEVFIPAVGPGSFDLTFRVEADNWLAALNTGLKKIGEKGGAGNNFLVDIQDDNSIHVTDPKSQRVFRIHELEAPPALEPDTAPGDTTAQFPNPFDPMPGRSTQLDLPAVAAKPHAHEPATLPPTPLAAGATQLVEPLPKPAAPISSPRNVAAKNTSGSHAASARPKTLPPAAYNPPSAPTSARPKTSGSIRRPSSMARNVTEVPREEMRPPTGRIGRERPAQQENIDDTLAELFDRVQEMEGFGDPEEALDFVLDLAMEKIAAESGSVFLADLSTNDLTLGAARGPKSKELLRLNPRVPMGVGIVGFCAQEGVSLAISDVQRDPRFFRAISDRIGYPTKSILSVPMIRNGRSFGCLEVLNKKVSTRFTEGEVAILAYLADATARYLESVG